MIRRLGLAAALAAALAFVVSTPAQAVLCWYCTGAQGAPGWCYTASSEIGGKGGTSCTDSGGSYCILHGLCPLTVLAPIGFDAGGNGVGGCALGAGPFRLEGNEQPSGNDEIVL